VCKMMDIDVMGKEEWFCVMERTRRRSYSGTGKFGDEDLRSCRYYWEENGMSL